MQLNIFRGLRPRAPAAVASEPAFRADSSPTPFKNPAHAPAWVLQYDGKNFGYLGSSNHLRLRARSALVSGSPGFRERLFETNSILLPKKHPGIDWNTFQNTILLDCRVIDTFQTQIRVPCQKVQKNGGLSGHQIWTHGPISINVVSFDRSHRDLSDLVILKSL